MSLIKSEHHGHVTVLMICRPEALNALNSQVLADLEAAIDKTERDTNTYVVILTGEGRSFVAGADIAEMKNFTAAGDADRYSYQLRLRSRGFRRDLRYK